VSDVTITPEMTMGDILTRYPAAQRALFQRYHVGGCSSCGFQPTDTLGQVCRDHNILDVNEVVDHIARAQEYDERMEIGADEVRAWLAKKEDFTFLDVRDEDEQASFELAGSEPLDFYDQDRYMALPKDRRIVFVCGDGTRSKDVAAYFIGHGFTNVRAVKRGVEGWRAAAVR
jgi:rhodanese-related sulfurtransferase